MIFYACRDLIFATRIRAAADQQHLQSRPCQSIEQLTTHLQHHNPDDPVTFFVDLDLGDAAMPLITAARECAPSATIIAFGPHVDKSRLEHARQQGADHVLPRSAFTRKLDSLLSQIQTP